MIVELGQLIIAALSGITGAGMILFRWGLLTHKLSADLHDRIESVHVELRDQSKATLHSLAILRKDISHNTEICNIQFRNDLNIINANLTTLQARLLTLEVFLSKTSSFRAHGREEENE